MTSSNTSLLPLKQPLAIRPDQISPHPTTIVVKQSLSWSGGDFSARNADGTLILTSDGKVLTKGARKEFKDASGLPLFSLRMSWISMSKAFCLQLPGDETDVMTVKLYWSIGKAKLDCNFKNSAEGNEEQEVKLEVRGQDSQHLVTSVSYEGNQVAIVRRQFADGVRGRRFKFKPEYEVAVAEGMDRALIAVIVVSLAGIIQTSDTAPPGQ